MKIEMKMYTVECDLCKSKFVDEYRGVVGWTDYETARENALESDWLENHQQDEKHYCPDCYVINDEDEVINEKTGAFLFNN